MATTWEAERFEFDHYAAWVDKYFFPLSPIVTADYEGSTIEVAVCKVCGSLVMAYPYGGDHLSDHRAWHDALGSKGAAT